MNKNVLGHTFIHDGGYFNCTKCGVIVYTIEGQYLISHRWKYRNDTRVGKKVLTLTCADVIIKSIIE